MAILRCWSCEGAVEPFFWGKHAVYFDPTPHCEGCFLERHEGEIPIVTGPTKNTPMGTGHYTLEMSPWQENAIRALEGD